MLLLKKNNVEVIPVSTYYADNFDYEQHIKNSIYSFIVQIISKKNFADFFVREKILHLHEKSTKIKKFFAGLICFLENLDDLNKKSYYWLLLNTEVNKVVLRRVYNTNHALVNDKRL